MYYLYFIKSEKFDRHYVGVTSNPKRRLDEHNCGENKSTKPYRPYKIIYLEEYDTKALALKKEWWIKNKPEGRWYKKNIIKCLNVGRPTG